MTKRRPSTLAKLLARVQHATKPYGKKAELARYLNASRQQVNGWLSYRTDGRVTGARAPGGEVTLLMLQWVVAEEAKRKSSGSADTPPERMTRTKGKSHEKHRRPSRKKK